VPGVTQKDLDRTESMTDAALKSYNVDDVFDDMIPIYQRHLTKADVSAMLAFYESPTGKKLLKEQPAIMAESMQVTRLRMKKVMGDLMDQIEHMAKEDGHTSHGGSTNK
jgi:uncharacterized protein